MDLDLLLDNVVTAAVRQTSEPLKRAPRWRDDEVRFLHENHARMPDEELATALGRSENAIKVFRVRQGLKAASRAATDWLTTNQVADRLGLDIHKIGGWCDAGLIPSQPSGRARQIRLVRMRDLKAWVVNPRNWVYFDWRKLPDPHLRRLCELRAARWNDEWWTTRQVAEYHGVDVKDVTRLIVTLKRIDAYCPPVSLGGRHAQRRWARWFVLKSVAVTVRFYHYGDERTIFTPRADAWILKARNQLGLNWVTIGRMMGTRKKKGPTGWTVRMRYERLMAQVGQAEDALFAGS